MFCSYEKSRSPLGLRGLKFASFRYYNLVSGRSPLGLRGLKFTQVTLGVAFCHSRSPLGLRGLKYPRAFYGWIPQHVAALLGCVD